MVRGGRAHGQIVPGLLKAPRFNAGDVYAVCPCLCENAQFHLKASRVYSVLPYHVLTDG
jgi:hypothetical protein